MALVKSKLKSAEETLAAAEASGDETSTSAARADVEAQRALREKWAVENRRRKHNYVPLIMRLLAELAKRGELEPMRAKAQEHAKAQREAAKARKQEAEQAKAVGAD